MANIIVTIKLIQKQTKKFEVPSVTKVSIHNDPYRVLVSCILSLRTKDRTTTQASQRLFRLADNPQDMMKLSYKKIEKLIYPVGFYRNKAKVILGASKKIVQEFKGRVPSKSKELLSIKGVGLKTANLVLGLGFGIAAICVDTHVHRISNRLGWIRTRKAEDSEKALRTIIPRRLWIELNTLLVSFGQNICLPVSPWCSKCLVQNFCKRIGVKRFR
jgi:endonuclease-3